MEDDGDGLLDDEDMSMGTTAAAVPEGGCETKKRACKDCSCGRAEIEAAEEAGAPLAQPIASSACGNVGVPPPPPPKKNTFCPLPQTFCHTRPHPCVAPSFSLVASDSPLHHFSHRHQLTLTVLRGSLLSSGSPLLCAVLSWGRFQVLELPIPGHGDVQARGEDLAVG